MSGCSASADTVRASILAVLVAGFCSGCESASPETPTSSATATTPTTRSVATLRSSDLRYINLDARFNTWLRSGLNSLSEIYLGLKPEPPTYSAPSEWALVIRLPAPNPTGVKLARDIDARLFKNYKVECCLNRADPMGAFESADKSFVAVSGYVDFESSDRARFSLNFQEEDPLRSNQTRGQIVEVVGCWNIAGEGRVSGCEL